MAKKTDLTQTETQEQKDQTTATCELDLLTWLDKFAKSEIDFGFGHLYRLQCKKCHDPLCTRILIRYEFDKRGNYLYRDCEKITEHQFTAIKDIKDKLNVG